MRQYLASFVLFFGFQQSAAYAEVFGLTQGQSISTIDTASEVAPGVFKVDQNQIGAGEFEQALVIASPSTGICGLKLRTGYTARIDRGQQIEIIVEKLIARYGEPTNPDPFSYSIRVMASQRMDEDYEELEEQRQLYSWPYFQSQYFSAAQWAFPEVENGLRAIQIKDRQIELRSENAVVMNEDEAGFMYYDRYEIDFFFANYTACLNDPEVNPF